jgi:hypothetical protein
MMNNTMNHIKIEEDFKEGDPLSPLKEDDD